MVFALERSLNIPEWVFLIFACGLFLWAAALLWHEKVAPILIRRRRRNSK